MSVEVSLLLWLTAFFLLAFSLPPPCEAMDPSFTAHHSGQPPFHEPSISPATSFSQAHHAGQCTPAAPLITIPITMLSQTIPPILQTQQGSFFCWDDTRFVWVTNCQAPGGCLLGYLPEISSLLPSVRNPFHPDNKQSDPEMDQIATSGSSISKLCTSTSSTRQCAPLSHSPSSLPAAFPRPSVQLPPQPSCGCSISPHSQVSPNSALWTICLPYRSFAPAVIGSVRPSTCSSITFGAAPIETGVTSKKAYSTAPFTYLGSPFARHSCL